MNKVKRDAAGEGASLCIRTSWGPIVVTASGGRVTSCTLPELRSEPRSPFAWKGARVRLAGKTDRRVLKKAEHFLKSTFAGEASEVPSYEWPDGTPFMCRVWRALAGIPRGATVEYGVLARRIGRPGGARAVGRVCGANPLPVFIPCHRVLPRDGSLGGFSGGLPWKRLLLEREGSIGKRLP